MIVFAQPIEQFPAHLAFSSVPVFSAGVDAAFPASNLLTYDPTQVARATVNGLTIDWDFGRPRKFNVVSLLSTNVSVRGTLRIEASLNGSSYTVLRPTGPFWAHLANIVASIPPGAATDEDLDPSAAFERNSSFWNTTVTQNYRYLRLVITDPGASAPLTFGRLFVGRSFKPKTSYQYGSALTFDDTAVKDRTDRGAQVLDPGRQITGASVKMDFLSTNEVYDYIYDFNYWRGSARELLCCLDVNTTHRLSKNLLYATISEGRRVTADQFESWSQTWILESI
jgi:hypothetical protein